MWGRGSIAGILVALAAAAPAWAEPAWAPTETISPFGWGAPTAAVNDDGKAVVAFGNGSVAVSTREPQGHFTPPVGLAEGMEQKVGLGADGWTAVAYRALQNSQGGTYKVSLKPPGDEFRAPVSLGSTEAPGHLWDFAVGVDGTMAIAYRGSAGLDIRIRRPGEDVFEAAQTIPWNNNPQLDEPKIVVDGTGRVVVFWSTSAPNYPLEYAERAPNDPDFTTGVVADTNDSQIPRIATSPEGSIALAWTRYVGENPVNELMVRPAGATFADARRSQPPADLRMRAIAVNDDATAILAGTSSDAARPGLQTYTDADGVPAVRGAGPPGSQSPRDPEVGLDADGDAVLLWREGPPLFGWPAYDSDRLVSAVLERDAEALTSVETRAVPAVNWASLVVSPSGTAVAAWEQYENGGPYSGGRACAKATVREEGPPGPDGLSCATAPPPTAYPGYVPPAAPPVPRLSVRFTGSSVIRLTSAAVTVTAACGKPCRFSTSGSVTTSGASRAYKLKGTRTKLLPAGAKAKLRLKLSKRDYKTVRKLLRKRRKVTASVRVVATDTAGARKAYVRKLRLKGAK